MIPDTRRTAAPGMVSTDPGRSRNRDAVARVTATSNTGTGPAVPTTSGSRPDSSLEYRPSCGRYSTSTFGGALPK